MRSWLLLSPETRSSFSSRSLTSKICLGTYLAFYANKFCYRYISNIEMPGGKIVYVPLQPPADGAVRTSSAAEWTLDIEQLEKAITPKTKMIVINTPRM